MTDERIIEAMAREMCVQGGYDPNQIMANDGPRWRYYVPGATAALAAYREIAGDEIAALRERAEKAERERNEAISLLKAATKLAQHELYGTYDDIQDFIDKAEGSKT